MFVCLSFLCKICCLLSDSSGGRSFMQPCVWFCWLADWLHNLHGREEMESLALKQLLSWRVARLKQCVNAVMSQYSILDRLCRDSFLYIYKTFIWIAYKMMLDSMCLELTVHRKWPLIQLQSHFPCWVSQASFAVVYLRFKLCPLMQQ